MKSNHTDRIEALKARIEPITAQDATAEGGRKALLVDFIQMLEHEDGSRTGTDIEDVHHMRVASRRIRSTFRLLEPCYHRKALSPFNRPLRNVAQALGAVRDLDVLGVEMLRFQETLDAEQQGAFQGVLDRLEKQRTAARADLVTALDSKSYRRLVKQLGAFLTKPGRGAKSPEDEVVPYQIRHVLPAMIYERLALVRAYETVLDDADAATLHGLRIEFKRLRYAVSLFDELLGPKTEDFVDELKAIQDHLGRLNDIASARDWLDSISGKLDDAGRSVLQAYMQQQDVEEQELLATFPEVWEHFNTRKVQGALSSALLALK